MDKQKFTLKYWKARAASAIFNHLWNDPESGLAAVVEKNANARAYAAIMSWLDLRRIQHCRYCIIVDEQPLKKLGGYLYCHQHITQASAPELVKAS